VGEDGKGEHDEPNDRPDEPDEGPDDPNGAEATSLETAYVVRDGDLDRPSAFVGVLSLIALVMSILLSLGAIAGVAWLAWRIGQALF